MAELTPEEIEYEIERLSEMSKQMETADLITDASKRARELVALSGTLTRRGVEAEDLASHAQEASNAAAKLLKGLRE